MSRARLRLASDFVHHRRDFILGGAAISILPWLKQITSTAVASSPRFDTDPFTLGVASGEPLPDSVVLWTRLAPDPLAGGGLPPEIYPVQWEIATDDAMRTIVQRGTELATPQLGHSIHAEVHGLEADRWYWYRFRCGDAVSPIGRTRTTPPVHAIPDRMRFAFVSCQSYEQGLYTGYDHMQREDLDLVVHLGDYIYEYGGKDGKVRRHTEARSSRSTTTAIATLSIALTNTCEPPCQVPLVDRMGRSRGRQQLRNDISEEKSVDRATLLLRRANAYQAFTKTCRSVAFRSLTVPTCSSIARSTSGD